MAPSYILQIFLQVAVQNQIRIAQRVVVDEVIQFWPLRHGHIQRILDPGAVDGNHSPIPEQQLHAPGVHVEFANSCIVLHVCVLSAFTALLPWSVVLSYDKVWDVFRCKQGIHSVFRRIQKIRTLLLSEKSSDFVVVVHLQGLEPWAH